MGWGVEWMDPLVCCRLVVVGCGPFGAVHSVDRDRNRGGSHGTICRLRGAHHTPTRVLGGMGSASKSDDERCCGGVGRPPDGYYAFADFLFCPPQRLPGSGARPWAPPLARSLDLVRRCSRPRPIPMRPAGRDGIWTVRHWSETTQALHPPPSQPNRIRYFRARAATRHQLQTQTPTDPSGRPPPS